MSTGGGGGLAEGLSCVTTAVGVRDGDLDPQSPSQALHPAPAEKPVPDLEIQTNQQEDDSSFLSGE